MKNISIVVAILRKDFLLFWPLAAITAALMIADRLDGPIMALDPTVANVITTLIHLVTPLAVVVLIVLVIQEDAVVSANHDWLTRPIPGGAMLAAKAIFIALAFIGSSVIGQVLNDLYSGYGFVEALLGGITFGAMGNTWVLLIGITALASLTATLRQAVVLAICVIAGLAAVWYVAVSLSGMLYVHGRFGIDWLVERTLMLTVIAVGAVVLWIQYVRRDVRTSTLLILAAVAVFTIFMSLLSWQRGFALQARLAPNPEAAKGVSLKTANGCFAASTMSDRAGLFSAAHLGADAMRVWVERTFAPDDIIFATTLVEREMPSGDKWVVDRVVGRYIVDGQEIETTLQPARYTTTWIESEGKPAAKHFWLLSKSDYERLARSADVALHLDYSLSLLAPTATAEISLDESTRSYAGIGRCSAKLGRGAQIAGGQSVEIKCLKMGSQPALMFAKPLGASDAKGKASDYLNYVPTALDFLGGKRHWMQVPLVAGSAPDRFQVTALEARAHFNRQIAVPGILGGSVSACPAPTAN